MNCEEENFKDRLAELDNRLKNLEKIVSAGLQVNLKVKVPKIILEKKPVDVRISEEELPGRIVILAKEGFFEEGRTVSEVAKELIRRCWHPKDLKHICSAMEQLTAIGILERMQEKRRRREGIKVSLLSGPT